MKGRPLTLGERYAAMTLLELGYTRDQVAVALGWGPEKLRVELGLPRWQPPRPGNLDRDREIVRLRAEGITQKAIADRYGITAARVRQICAKGS